jgi:hypothetical protein
MSITQRERSRLLVGAVAAALVLTGCSSSSSSGGPSFPPQPTESASPLVTSVPVSFADLQALIVADVPAGFVEQPDSVGDTGPSDLAKATRDDHGAPHPRRELTRTRFVRGYQRLWLGPQSTQLIVFIYQFSKPAGAVKYRKYTAREERRRRQRVRTAGMARVGCLPRSSPRSDRSSSRRSRTPRSTGAR